MNTLLAQLDAMGISLQMLILSLIFFTVVLLVFGTSTLLEGRRPLPRRVSSSEPTVTLRPGGTSSTFGSFLEPLSKNLLPKDPKEFSALRLRLVQAGYLSPSAAPAYFLIRVVLALVLPVLFLLLSPMVFGNISPSRLLVVGTVGLAVGFYGPSYFLRSRIRSRQEAARVGFPDALDMLLVCVEAGQGLNAALARVSQEVGKAHPILGEQFQLVALELQAGVPKETALRNLASRLAVDEVSSLVTLLLQAENYGTSIADSLRIHASEMRRMRLLRAEERANRLPVLISLPLMLFILPALIDVIMTPVIIRVVRILLPALAGD